MHRHASGNKIRLVLEENVAIDEIKSKINSSVEVKIYSMSKANMGCLADITFTFAYNQQKTNGYKVGVSYGGGSEIGVGVESAQWAPIAVEARAKVFGNFAITGELSRQEVVGFSASTQVVISQCWEYKTEVFWQSVDATATQKFGDRVTCDVQGGGMAEQTTCNEREIAVKANGTPSIRDVTNSIFHQNCCPTDPPEG
jgi:hypothetical protein